MTIKEILTVETDYLEKEIKKQREIRLKISPDAPIGQLEKIQRRIAHLEALKSKGREFLEKFPYADEDIGKYVQIEQEMKKMVKKSTVDDLMNEKYLRDMERILYLLGLLREMVEYQFLMYNPYIED